MRERSNFPLKIINDLRHESTQSCTTRFFISLLPCIFDDQSSPNFHRFVNLCIHFGIHKIKTLVFGTNQRYQHAFKWYFFIHYAPFTAQTSLFYSSSFLNLSIVVTSNELTFSRADLYLQCAPKCPTRKYVDVYLKSPQSSSFRLVVAANL